MSYAPLTFVAGFAFATCIASATTALAQTSSTPALRALDQNAIVYLHTICEDKETGALSEPKGSGFLIERNGYIVTTLHAIDCQNPSQGFDGFHKTTTARIASPKAAELPVTIGRYVNAGAILQRLPEQ